jgi:hypothetical protein
MIKKGWHAVQISKEEHAMHPFGLKRKKYEINEKLFENASRVWQGFSLLPGKGEILEGYTISLSKKLG